MCISEFNISLSQNAQVSVITNKTSTNVQCITQCGKHCSDVLATLGGTSVIQGWIPNQNLTGTPSPALPFPPLPLEVGPLNPARVSGGALQAPPVVSGAKPQPTNDLVHIWAKRSSSGDNSFMDFRRNKFNFLVITI